MSLDKEVLKLQKRAMFLTLEQFERQIAEAEHFTPDEAIMKGLIYVSRVIQESNVALQIAKDSEDHEEEKRINASIDKLNNILQKAGTGSFIALRMHLQDVGEYQLKLSEVVKTLGDIDKSDQFEKMGAGYLRMVVVIPDTGKPLSLGDKEN